MTSEMLYVQTPAAKRIMAKHLDSWTTELFRQVSKRFPGNHTFGYTATPELEAELKAYRSKAAKEAIDGISKTLGKA